MMRAAAFVFAVSHLVFLPALAENYSAESIRGLVFKFESSRLITIKKGEFQTTDSEQTTARQTKDGSIELTLKKKTEESESVTQVAFDGQNNYVKKGKDWDFNEEKDKNAQALFLGIVSAWPYYQQQFGGSMQLKQTAEGRFEGRECVSFEINGNAVSGNAIIDKSTKLPLYLTFSGQMKRQDSIVNVSLKIRFTLLKPA